MKLKPSQLAVSIVGQHPNRKYMSDREARNLARKLDLHCLTTYTPQPLKLIPWRPRIRVTRHHLYIGVVAVRLTNLTGSGQYARLWSVTGSHKLADKLQAKFNAQFNRNKRLSTWTPGKILS